MLDVVLSDPHFWNLSSTISIYIRVRSYVNSLVSVFLLLFFFLRDACTDLLPVDVVS